MDPDDLSVSYPLRDTTFPSRISRLNLILSLLVFPVFTASPAYAEDIVYPCAALGSYNNLYPASSLSGNNVTVNAGGSDMIRDVYGAMSLYSDKEAIGNTVIINGGQITGRVYGAMLDAISDNNAAKDNHVTINADVYSGNDYLSVTGGRATYGISDKNTVDIRESGSAGEVYGGYGEVVTNNRVTVGDQATLTHYGANGGYAGSSGSATNNTVTLEDNARLSGSSLVGGSGKISQGNTVYIQDNAQVDNSSAIVSGGQFLRANGEASGNKVIISL